MFMKGPPIRVAAFAALLLVAGGAAAADPPPAAPRAPLFSPPQPKRPRGPPPNMRSMTTLLAGLLNSESGSPAEGPKLGEPAPDFTLPAPDENKDISLHAYRAGKPLVLIFGSF